MTLQEIKPNKQRPLRALVNAHKRPTEAAWTSGSTGAISATHQRSKLRFGLLLIIEG